MFYVSAIVWYNAADSKILMQERFHTSHFRDILQLMRFNILNRKLIDYVLGSLKRKRTFIFFTNRYIYQLITIKFFVFCFSLSGWWHELCSFCFWSSFYLGDISCSSEAKCDRANGFGHKPHGNLIPTIPHCLDCLADIPVVVTHADVLWKTENGDDGILMTFGRKLL